MPLYSKDDLARMDKEKEEAAAAEDGMGEDDNLIDNMEKGPKDLKESEKVKNYSCEREVAPTCQKSVANLYEVQF